MPMRPPLALLADVQQACGLLHLSEEGSVSVELIGLAKPWRCAQEREGTHLNGYTTKGSFALRCGCGKGRAVS